MQWKYLEKLGRLKKKWLKNRLPDEEVMPFEKSELQMPNSYGNGLKFDDEVQLKKKIPAPLTIFFYKKKFEKVT